MSQNRYEGSHSILAVIEFLGWASSILAACAAIYASIQGEGITAAAFWMAVVVAGVGLAAVARVGRAILDIASNTAKTAQALQGQTHAPATTPRHPDAPVRDELSKRGWPLGQIEIYRGHVITGLDTQVFTNNRYFDSVDEAKIHLNSIPAKLA